MKKNISKKRISFKKDYEKGFTLIETLIAIAILSIAITATFGSVQRGLQVSNQAKNQIVAFYLAQDAVELIKNRRDENSLNNVDWMTGVAESSGGPCGPTNACYIDSVNNTISSCSGACAPIRQDTDPNSSTYGLYSYTGSWTPSNFTRTANITTLNANEVLAEVTLSWNEGSTVRSFTARDLILNWQP